MKLREKLLVGLLIIVVIILAVFPISIGIFLIIHLPTSILIFCGRVGIVLLAIQMTPFDHLTWLVNHWWLILKPRG